MTRCILVVCSLVLITLALGLCVPARRVPTENPFPLSLGTYWIYRGHVRWTHENSNQVSDARIAWRADIRRVIDHGDVRGVVVSGFPFDSAWSDGRPTASDSLLVESKNKFYLISSENVQKSVRRLEQPADNLDGLLSDDDLILEWPLATGQKYACDAYSMARSDNMYCWIVSALARTSLQGVSGIPSGERDEYVLEFRTNPDDTEFSFVPEIGITKYAYHHHGTVADTELQLVEFHPGSVKRD